MRRIVQVLFLLLFTLLFFLAAYPLTSSIPVDLFLKTDPLSALASCLASREIHTPLLLSLIILGLTFVCGRFFCGYVCPLGTLIDFSHQVIPERKTAATDGTDKNPALKTVKYYLLIIILVAALLSLNLAYLFDPISFLTRVYTFLVYPFTILSINFILDLLRPLAARLHLVALSHKHYIQPLFYMNLATLILFAGIFLLTYFSERFWCRNLCPLGALLSSVSRRGIFKRQVSDACNTCMKCRKECPMGAIAHEPRKTLIRECIQCLHCSAVCPQSAISFKPILPASPGEISPQVNLSRRGVLLSLGAGALVVVNVKTAPFARVSYGRLVRPPGALPEPEFLKRCIRCGECMKVCLTNTLQPCQWEGGLEGLWSPRLFPRLAGCDQTCSLCGQVCPTGAIRNLPLEEKKHAKLGTAVIDRGRCLVWEQQQLCLICDEQCPYNAIVFKWYEGFRRPFVIANKCNGCGFCEQKCPVAGESAILVIPQGELRLAQGSYTEAAQKLNLEFKEDPGADRFLLEEEKGKGLSRGTGVSGGKEKLPEGFSLK